MVDTEFPDRTLLQLKAVQAGLQKSIHQEKQVILVGEAHFKTVEFEISGMTCQGCAEHVMYEVNKVPGVIRTIAPYERANTIVGFDDTKTSDTEIEDAINKTGYKVESSSAFQQGK